MYSDNKGIFYPILLDSVLFDSYKDIHSVGKYAGKKLNFKNIFVLDSILCLFTSKLMGFWVAKLIVLITIYGMPSKDM